MSVEELRNCKNCGNQPLSKFYSHIEKKTNRFRYRCKYCQINQGKDSISKEENKKRSRLRVKKWYDKRRLLVLQHYSAEIPLCECCKESHLDFLALDHKFGGGNIHRKQVGSHIIHWIINNNYPDIFRVLCHNCNFALGNNWCGQLPVVAQSLSTPHLPKSSKLGSN